MPIPEQFRQEAEAFPPLLKALLEAELAAGNTIREAGHRFPAPPAGAYFKMSAPFTTRPRSSGDGLTFRDHNSSTMAGSFTDDRGFYYLIEPPGPPPPVPDMDAIRAALRRDGEAAVSIAGLLLYVYGKAEAPFDWDQRPFLIRFHTQNRKEREAAFCELCDKVGVNASDYP